MKTSLFLRLSTAVLLLAATTLSACDALDIAPKGAKKDCKTETATDSTGTAS